MYFLYKSPLIVNKYHHHPHKYRSHHNIIIIITIEHEATLALMASRQQDKRDNSTSVTAIAAVIVIVEILTARWQIIRFTDFQWKVIPISESTQTILLCFPYQVSTIHEHFASEGPTTNGDSQSHVTQRLFAITEKMTQSQRVPASYSPLVKTGFNRTQSDRKVTPR